MSGSATRRWTPGGSGSIQLPHRRTSLYLEQLILRHGLDLVLPPTRRWTAGGSGPRRRRHPRPNPIPPRHAARLRLEIAPKVLETETSVPSPSSPRSPEASSTLRNVFLDADQFSRSPFLSCRQLVEYVILDVVSGTRYCPAFAQVSVFGKNLHRGDYALGYDLYAGANTNGLEIDKYKALVLPDTVLMKKSYEEKRLRRARDDVREEGR